MNFMKSFQTFLAPVVFTTLLFSCSGGNTSTAISNGSSNPAVTLTGITITPFNPTVVVLMTVNLTATGTYSDGTTADITSTVAWNSSNTTVASVNAGVVTGNTLGSANISATSDNITSNSVILSVNAPALLSITITPTNPTVTVLMTANLTATGTYENSTTADITSTVTWSSSNSAIASVIAGVITGNSAGTANITASLNGASSLNTVVTVTAATLTGITISPTAPSVAKGITQQFSAQGTFNNGTTGNITTSVTWNSSNTAIATLNASGLATTTGQGTTNITASLSGATSNIAVLTVTAPVLTSIAVTPANPNVPRGTTQQFSASGTMSDGTTATALQLGAVTWTSATTANATINATGLASVPNNATIGGASIITASAGGKTSNTTLTVAPATLLSIAITSLTGSYTCPGLAAAQTYSIGLPKGCSYALQATGTWSDATTGLITNGTWASSSTAATVTQTGVVTAALTGGTNITVSSSGVTSPNFGISVIAPVQVSVSVSVSTTTPYTRTTILATAMSNLSDGTSQACAAPFFSYSPASSSVLFVQNTATGDTLADNPGTATIDASCLGMTGSSAPITPVISKIWMSGSNTMDAVGVYGTKGTAAATNVPGARQSGASWYDSVGGNLWMFGGAKCAMTCSAFYNDLWKYNIASGQWTWVNGSNAAGAAGVYGTKGTAAATNVPGARSGAAYWFDGSNLWLLGGYGFDGSATPVLGHLNDLWKYNLASGQWTWVNGSSVPLASGVYGTKGTAAAANTPGARGSAAYWYDSAGGNLMLFGGYGCDNTATCTALTQGYLNDLWKFNIVAGQWTWIDGSNVKNASGVYGTKGTFGAGNYPGARTGASSGVDVNGNVFLFGGWGYDSAGTSGTLNDGWADNGGSWIWMSGSNTVGGLGTGATMGTFSTLISPSFRNGAIGVSNGTTFYMYSGASSLSDLWKYDSLAGWMWLGTGPTTPNYGTLGVVALTNDPGARVSSSSWIDSTGNIWIFGGSYYNTGTATWGSLNDLWKISP